MSTSRNGISSLMLTERKGVHSSQASQWRSLWAVGTHESFRADASLWRNWTRGRDGVSRAQVQRSGKRVGAEM